MANTTNTVKFNVDSNQAVAALTALQNKVSQTGDMFGKLKGAIAGLAIGALIKDALAYADAISDLSDATGVAVQNIVGFQKAVQGAGGSTEGAQKGILKLVNSIGDAAGGSAEAQDAFLRVGVTLKDLATLSEQDILRKTVKGLSNINDVSTQSILKTALLGKEFRNVSAAKLEETLDKATAASEKYAEAIKKAADAQDQFDKAAGAAKMALIDLISPLTQFLGALPGDKLEEFVGGLVKLAAVVAVVYGWMLLLAKAAAAAAELGGIVATIAAFATGIGEVLAAIALLIAGFVAINQGIKIAFDVSPIDWFTDKVKNAYRAVREFMGLPRISADDTAGAGRGGSDAMTKQLQEQGEAMRKQSQASRDAAEKEAENKRKVTDAFEKQRQAIRQSSEEFSKSNKKIIDSINVENSLIGATKSVSDVTKAQEEIFKRAADEADKLRDAKEKLSEAEKRRGLGAEYDRQIAKIQELANADSARVKTAIENTQRLEMADKLRLFSLQNQIDKEGQLRGLQDDIAKSTMNEIEKKYYDIDAAARESAKSAIQAEEARRNAKMPIEEQRVYYEEALKGTKDLKASQEELYNTSRSFQTGWTQAFNQYVDDATNAANMARNIFQKATSGMEDMIVNFAKTGKLEFKSFVNSMLEELLRSQVRSMMASLFTAGKAGLAGGGGGLGGLLGFASGGVIPTNKPVLVGERGPEILTGAGGRTVIPNSALGGGSSQVTYNIQAVDAMSFKQMLAADPSFIHAVASQGAKSIPGRR